MRKNEITRISVKVKGYEMSGNNEEKQKYHRIENADLSKVLEALFAAPPQFEKSFVDIDEDVSKKYQKIGLVKVKKTLDKGVTFYHFKAGYIYRDKEDLQKIDIKGMHVKKITLGDQEFQYMTLHFSLVPAWNAAILDSKCHSRATAFFLHQLLLPFLNATDYLLLPDSLDERLYIKIRPIPKSDFDEVVKKRLNSLRSVGIELAKPNAMKMAAYEPDELEEDMEFFMGPVGKIVGSFFGIDSKEMTLEDIPFKKVRIQFILDEESKSLQPYKTGVKGFIDSRKTSPYLKDTELSYKDTETGEIERAFLSGTTLTEQVKTDPKLYDKETKMWQEQRETFLRNKDLLK